MTTECCEHEINIESSTTDITNSINTVPKILFRLVAVLTLLEVKKILTLARKSGFLV